MSNLSASLSMNSSLGPGKVRAMFQARRNGGASAQGSPVGWDKSYPLEPISRSAPSSKHSTPGGRRSNHGSNASGARRQQPPQQPVSGRRPAKKGAGKLRRSRSQTNLAPDGGGGGGGQKAAAGAGKRSRSLSTRQRKPSHRQDEVNKINDEMRRREGEMLNRARGNTLQKPQALRSRDQNAASKKAKAAPPNTKKTLRPKENGSSAPAASRSRRNSFSPYKENKPPASPAPRPPPSDPNLAQCPICQRSFAKDRLEKHQLICQKSHEHDKKRKTFDPVKMRMQGTESEKYIKKVKTNRPEELSPTKKIDWRKQHEEFVHNIREAKRVQAHLAAGGDVRDLPTPTPAANDDYVQCPHCQRRFSPAAADRHIPKCSSITSNKPTAKPAGRGKSKTRRR